MVADGMGCRGSCKREMGVEEIYCMTEVYSVIFFGCECAVEVILRYCNIAKTITTLKSIYSKKIPKI
jgi:hypothetical protein